MGQTFKANAVTKDNIFGGAARLLWAATTVTKPVKISDIINVSTGALTVGWNDFGATDGGLSMKRSFDKTTWEVDQVLGAIDEFITGWNMSVSFSAAETTLENIKTAWAGGTIVTDTTLTPDEKTLGIGAPETIDEVMVAFLIDKRKIAGVGYVRAYIYWRAKWDGSDSEHAYKKGEKALIPTTLTLLADPSVGAGKEYGIVIDQVA